MYNTVQLSFMGLDVSLEGNPLEYLASVVMDLQQNVSVCKPSILFSFM